MKAVARTVVAAAIAVSMVACGGGGGDSGGSDAPAGSEVGVLTDGPVGGVAYTTSGGYEGLTDGSGRFNYNPGETVTFSIGSTTLGTATASATVTPIELAGTGAGAANKVTNLLVLLQSLDADGDPSDGITITAAARTAADTAPALNLAAAPATFSASTGLGALMDASGTVNTAPVAVDDALAHFREQFFGQLRGAWVARQGSDLVLVRFEQNGDYAIGEIAAADGGGQTGIETGRMGWNATTGAISATVTLDTNGDWGLSDLDEGESARIEGDKLLVRESDGEVFAFERVRNDAANPIVGMWALGSPTDVGRQTFVFGANGTYVMIDPVGDEDGNCPVQRGLEVGNYTFSGSTLSVTQPARIDQNGCAGLWDAPANSGSVLTLQFNADKSTMTVQGATLYRISR